MTHSKALARAPRLAAPLAAQQFQLELARDVLGQKSINTQSSPVAGDGKIDLLFAGNTQFSSIDADGVPTGASAKPTLLGIAARPSATALRWPPAPNRNGHLRDHPVATVPGQETTNSITPGNNNPPSSVRPTRLPVHALPIPVTAGARRCCLLSWHRTNI